MPTNHEYLPMSLVTFSRDSRETVFLMYSSGFENGPGIQRNGQGSPWMVDPQDQHRRVTDPHEQRKRTWFINKEARYDTDKLIPSWEQSVKDRRDTGLMEPEDAAQRLQYYEELKSSLPGIADYETEFKRLYPGWEIVGIQGCGNLSMNEWYVGFVKSPLTANRPQLIALLEDRSVRIPPRQYTCLVKYLDGEIRIETLEFNFLTQQVMRYSDQEDLTGKLEFAVYGTQVLIRSELADFSDIVEQIADVRHLFKLPNLNPRNDTENEPNKRPRRLFGERQYDDVWFGEAELLTNLALRRAALSEPVLLNRQFQHMGADPEYMREILASQGYREDTERHRFLRYEFVPQEIRITLPIPTFATGPLVLPPPRISLLSAILLFVALIAVGHAIQLYDWARLAALNARGRRAPIRVRASDVLWPIRHGIVVSLAVGGYKLAVPAFWPGFSAPQALFVTLMVLQVAAGQTIELLVPLPSHAGVPSLRRKIGYLASRSVSGLLATLIIWL